MSKKKYQVPERLKHVFDFYDIEAKETPDLVLPDSISRLKVFGPSFVYLIKCKKYVKIGKADDIKSRIDLFQTGNPYPIKLLKAFKSLNPGIDERRLHRRLVRYRHIREWFILPKAVLNKILSLKDLSALRAV